MIIRGMQCWHLSALLACGLAMVVVAADDSVRPDLVSKSKTTMNGNDNARLEGYLHGESKYNILPVPAPLNRELASTFVARELPAALDPDTAGKLARLAIYHDLRDTAEGFARLLRLGESTAHDAGRTVAAIAALAWIGDAPQAAAARQHYAGLLRRDDVEELRETLLAAAHALGPAEGSAGLQQAITASVSTLRLRISELRPPNQAGVVDNLETRIDRLEEFSAREIKALDRANGVRRELLAETNAATQIAGLVALYLEDHPQGTRRLSEWAAFRLVRLPDRAKVGAVFIEAAASHARVEPSRQKELDLTRARALRAAEFFEVSLSAEARAWLAARPDEGADLLALRPDWQYPPPHSH